MAFDGIRMVSVPASLMEPARRPTIPMIDSAWWSCRTVTPEQCDHLASRTSKSMPCRMCIAVPRVRPFTSSRLGMPRSEVRLDHARILGHGAVVAFGEDLASLQQR